MKTTLMPLIEVNRPGADVKTALAGLATWKKHGGTDVIVSTHSKPVEVLRACLLNGLCIRPGFKTVSLLGGKLDSGEAWSAVGEIAESLEAMQHGKFPMLLECESAIGPYGTGDTLTDWPKVRKAISQLPQDIHWWVYPGSTNDDASVRVPWMQKWVGMWARRIRNVRFIDTTWGTPAAKASKGGRSFRKFLEKYATIPMLYVQSKYWKPEQIPGLLEEMGNPDEVILYSGLNGFLDMADKVGKLMGGW